MRLRALVGTILAALLVAPAPSTFAKGSRSSTSTSSKKSSSKSSSKTKKATGEEPKKVHVKGYTKKDGTYVPPHDRAAPGSKSPGSTASAGSSSDSGSSGSSKCTTCARDKDGRIERSESAKRDFMKSSGYPGGRPGYVVDHIVPLACGGADSPSNMQWQTEAEAKAKDGWERKGCGK